MAGAAACAAAGADFAGLNFVTGVRREIDMDAVDDIMFELGNVTAVGVFRDQDLDFIRRVARRTGLRWVQLHGAEPNFQCLDLGTQFRVIKALTAEDDPTPYEDCVDLFLMDGRLPGSGASWDYARVQTVRAEKPLLLAGGLTPDNVRAAIRAAQPDGVDVASGVERDGEQDPELIHAFVRAARAATESQT